MSFINTGLGVQIGSLGEVNGKLVADNENSPALSELNANLYPSIKVETLVPLTPDYVNEAPKQANIIENIYSDIKTTIQQQIDTNLPLIESTAVYQQGKKVYEHIYNNYLKSPEFVLAHSKFKETDLIKCIAWHPHLDMIAVGAQDNQVYLYEKVDSVWTCLVLRHDKMKHITCLEWKAKSVGTLAVGCKSGVCIWTLPRAVARQQAQYHPSATMFHLVLEEQIFVSSLAWDPTPGSHALAIVSALSNTLTIHDLLLNRAIPLKRYGRGNILLRWSPSGEWLFEGGSGGYSRLWDTRTWNSRQIINPPGLWIQAACWSPDNRTLIYSMGGKSDIHAIFLTGSDVKSNLFDLEIIATPSTTVNITSGSAPVGGTIRDLAIDVRNGQRLAVIYDNSSLISLYSIKKVSPVNLRQEPMLYPIGHLSGAVTLNNTYGTLETTPVDKNTKPLSISFSSTFKQGAVLAITWDNGLVTFATHVFLTEEEIRTRIL